MSNRLPYGFTALWVFAYGGGLLVGSYWWVFPIATIGFLLVEVWMLRCIHKDGAR